MIAKFAKKSYREKNEKFNREILFSRLVHAKFSTKVNKILHLNSFDIIDQLSNHIYRWTVKISSSLPIFLA